MSAAVMGPSVGASGAKGGGAAARLVAGAAFEPAAALDGAALFELPVPAGFRQPETTTSAARAAMRKTFMNSPVPGPTRATFPYGHANKSSAACEGAAAIDSRPIR